MSFRTLGFLSLSATLALVACQSQPDPVREAAEWTLTPAPDLVIGEDGTREGEFDRIAAVLALPGEEIAVVDGGHREIRVFSTTGSHQRTLGRQGEGPGEFNGIAWVELDYDTLVVFDLGQRRATLLGLDGTVHATIVLRPEGGTGFVFSRTRAANGSWVVTTSFGAARLVDQNAPPPSGVYRDTVGVGLLPAAGAGPVHYFLRTPSHSVVGVAGQNMVMRARFSADLQMMRVGLRVAVADPESATLRWYSADGREESVVNLAIPRRPLLAAEVDRLRGEALGGVTSPRGRLAVEASYSSEAVPAHLPVFASVLSDGEDQLWLEEWRYETAAPARYLVVGSEGDWRASVPMPPGFKPATIGPDWVLGIHRDADGVQRVMRYGLTRR